MAFNFNWSPLTADASFYTRAQELLTAALNKSPKPPIIVDNILVNELNLGSVPPDLEILEIGDLAEDRFRGIFKMCYTGDAFLTLKTRVQVNPLNTYLSTTPSFTSPQPLAASSGLTIPLQITLSDIKLSAFIILVFSRQKGLTLVFRNDPLESLKVSSTFDSIPFVRDYLQKEIEGQLRTLLMEEVPAIIHRLSLRLWVPEYQAREDEELARRTLHSTVEDQVLDPLSSPPEDPVDMSGNSLDATQIASLSLESSAETHSLFSQKNLLRLAALTDSHRTLSLFTPGLRDVVFRAWAGPTERGEGPGNNTPITPQHPGILRRHSHAASTGTSYTFSDGSETGSLSTRPTLSSYGSTFTGLSLGSGKHGKQGRKRKHRIVNLRKPKSNLNDVESISDEGSVSATISSAASESGFYSSTRQEREGELVTPPSSPQHKVRFQRSLDNIDASDTPRRLRDLIPSQPTTEDRNLVEPRPQSPPPIIFQSTHHSPPGSSRRPQLYSTRYFASYQYPSEKPQSSPSFGSHSQNGFVPSPFPHAESSPAGILEQAWMARMTGEIVRRVEEQKSADGGFWDRGEREDTPPPAYGM